MISSGNIEGWTELVEDLRSRNFFKPNTSRILLELLFHVSLLLLGMTLFFLFEKDWPGLLGLGLAVLGTIGVSTNTHTSTHGGTSKNALVNSSLTYFGYPFLLGLSATHWQFKHCKIHHFSPNIVGVDGDIQFMPFFAITDKDCSSSNWLRIYYQNFQYLLAPIVISQLGLSMQINGWYYLLKEMFVHHNYSTSTKLDLVCLIGHFTVFLLLPSLVFSTSLALQFYLLRSILVSYGVFTIFAPGHFPEEALCAEPQPGQVGFIERQVLTTANFRLNRLLSIFVSGLQFQIEHHLFPRVDHTRYRDLSVEVKAFCEKNGLPYHEFSWGVAVRKACVPFFRLKQVRERLVSES